MKTVFRIEVDGIYTKVFRDDVEIKDLTRFTFKAEPGAIPEVEMGQIVKTDGGEVKKIDITSIDSSRKEYKVVSDAR